MTMGYDMHFVQRGEDDYFRLNIWSMRRFIDYMAERSMIFNAGEPPQDWPQGDYELYKRWKYPEDFKGAPALTDEQRRKAEAYDRARREHLSWHGPEIPGIPVHKLCSNDGWIVIPAECEAAVKIGRERPAPVGDEDYWLQWLDYLDRARSRGGFEVW